MSRNRRQANGDIREESPNKIIKRLTQQLSNTQRELQLSDQIRSQLEKISATSTTIKDLTTKLLYEIADLTDKELEDLHKQEVAKKTELKRLEQRLQMLREIESNECRLNVKFIAYKTSNKNNALLIDNKEVFVDKDDDNEETEADGSGYEPSNRVSRSRHSSYGTETHTQDSWQSLDMEGELKDLTPYRSGRKRIIPERFESFPSGSKRRTHGMTQMND